MISGRCEMLLDGTILRRRELQTELAEWVGVGQRVWGRRMRTADRIDWSRAAIGSASVRAVGGGERTGPNPTDRRKRGSKHHVITDAKSLPLATKLTAANRHDVTQLIPLVDAIRPVRGKRGRPRRRPSLLYGDRAYDSHRHRMLLWDRGIALAIARRNTEHGSGLGVHRRVVERTLSWLHQCRRLRTRYDRRADVHEAFLAIASSLICWRTLKHGFI